MTSIKKSNLILPDADVIIHLHQLGLWDKFKLYYDVFVAQTVIDESLFFEKGSDKFKTKKTILFDEDLKNGTLIAIDVNLTEQNNLYNEAKKFNIEKSVDPGEFDKIATVFGSNDKYILSLIDSAAIHFAVMVGLEDQLISFEKAIIPISNNAPLGVGLTDKRFQNILKNAKTERVQKLL